MHAQFNTIIFFSMDQSLKIENMSSFQTQDQKHMPKLLNKKRLNQDQVRLLERSFTTHKKLDPELKLKLANQLGVPPRQVAIWYQNKRARWKTQSLELDYNTVQVKLENALAEKRRLERDVKQLKEELKQAQDMLFALNQKTVVNPFVSCDSNNTCCSDQRGSCSLSLHNEDVHGDRHLQVLQLDELYACLIGGGRSAWG